MNLVNLCSLTFLVGLSVFLGGCEPYVSQYEYLPHPAIIEMGSATTRPNVRLTPPLITYATVRGVRREDRDKHIPSSVEIRIRFERTSPPDVEIDPASLELVTGDLFRFAPPVVQPPQTITLGAGQSIVLDVYFPFPPGTSYQRLNMGMLLLQWRVRVGDLVTTQTARFRRIDPGYYYDPRRDWGYPYNMGYPFVGGNAEVQRSDE